MQKATIILVAGLILATIFLAGCTQSPSGLATASSNAQPHLKVGFQTQDVSTLVVIADQKGLFKEEGLDMELVDFSAGKFALQALLANQVDFAIVGDVPIVLAAMAGNEFYVIGQPIESSNENRVIALKDGGLNNPRDYFLAKKRKVSTFSGGTAELFTAEFMSYYGINMNQIELVYQKPEDSVAAISSKSIDAVSFFEPYPYIAEKKLGNEVMSFESPPGIYSSLYSVVAQKQLVDKNPQAAVKFMRALIKAQKFVEENPEEAQKLVAKRSGFALDEIQVPWDRYVIKATITNQLILNWEKVAKWAIDTNKTKSAVVLDFNKILRKDLFNEAAGVAK